MGRDAISSRVRRLGREATTGVVEALNDRPRAEEPAWRAERMARGFVRGIEQELGGDPALQGRVLEAIGSGVRTVFSSGIDSGQAEALAAAIGRGAARGALDELRRQLRDESEESLAPAMTGFVVRVTGDLVRTARPSLRLFTMCAVGFGAGMIARALARR